MVGWRRCRIVSSFLCKNHLIESEIFFFSTSGGFARDKRMVHTFLLHQRCNNRMILVGVKVSFFPSRILSLGRRLTSNVVESVALSNFSLVINAYIACVLHPNFDHPFKITLLTSQLKLLLCRAQLRIQ